MRLLLFFSFLVLIAGCKYSDKESLMSNDIDSLLIYNSENYVEKAKYEKDLSNIRSEMNIKIDSLKILLEQNIAFESNKFHIIVGSFSIESNAVNYSKKMKDFGYEGRLLTLRNGYKMVTAKSYNNLRSSLNDLNNIRESVTEHAWIYISE